MEIFDIKDLFLSIFFGIGISRSCYAAFCLFSKYALDLLHFPGNLEAKAIDSPLEMNLNCIW